MPETPALYPHSPAAERNREPILKVLQALLPESGHALEIASGTGQHAACFAAALPGWQWQPTDVKSSGFAAITHWADAAGARNVRPPLRLDVMDTHWPSETGAFGTAFDLIFCANMLHIAPWPTCRALMQGAARHLAPNGMLVTYGPYLEDDVITAPGNLAFDADLRARNPSWGIRRRADVEREAASANLALTARHAMPANNLLLVFQRTG
ncbi:MAG: DUF938 domain-containing protein [Ottowia sp.]|uniref:DUF938 domain-containing protein n=1 Tax=unclassified Ottowia TaxID=2645081 RepID=UPI003C2E7816